MVMIYINPACTAPLAGAGAKKDFSSFRHNCTSATTHPKKVFIQEEERGNPINFTHLVSTLPRWGTQGYHGNEGRLIYGVETDSDKIYIFFLRDFVPNCGLFRYIAK